MWNTVNAAMVHENARRRELKRKLEAHLLEQEVQSTSDKTVSPKWLPQTPSKLMVSIKNARALRPPSTPHTNAKGKTPA